MPEKTVKSPGVCFALRYVWRHIYRAVWQTVLTILIAGIMLAAAGQFGVALQSYETICENTVVTARFMDGVSVGVGRVMINFDYATNLYYAGNVPSQLNGSQINVVLTNNISRYTEEKIHIEFAPGYDENCLSEPGSIVILGNGVIDMYSHNLGDTVPLISNAKAESLWSQAYLEYARRHLHSETEPDQTELNNIYQKLFTQSLEEYTIAGVVSTPSGNYANTIFMPGSAEMESAYSSGTATDLIEVTLSDYRQLDELRDYGERITKSVPNTTFVLDSEKLEAPLNTLNLLTKMYPTIMVAALVIGAFLCCLILLQSSKEVSIMRVLGTTKGRTITIMSLEQIFLCIIGLILGFAGLIIYNRRNLLPVMGQLGIFTAAYLAVIVLVALVTSTLIMRRDLLTLLQTKE